MEQTNSFESCQRRYSGRRVIIIACLATVNACAQISYVVPPGTPDANPSAPYDSWASAATSIHEAVAAAAGQGWTNVWLSNGTYYLTGQVVIASAMTVRSWNKGDIDRNGTIVDGNSPGFTNRCFWLDHPQAVLRGLTITNGAALTGSANPGKSGGGIYVTNSAVLDDCLVTGNRSEYYGGGVYLDDGGMVTNCEIVANESTNYGGGLYVRNNGVLVDTVVSNNKAIKIDGGGIYMDINTEARRCMIASNWAGGFGGGIYAKGGLIDSNQFYGNSAHYSGGLFSLAAEARHCIMVGNTSRNTTRSSGYGGGGVYIAGGLLEDSLISNNTSGAMGGGIAVDGGIVRRCDVVNNHALGTGSTHGGGGLFISTNSLVDACLIADNIGNSGGGINFWTGGGEIRNCLIRGNYAGNSGGGIYHYRTGLHINNCTIVSNHSVSNGGGVYIGTSNEINHLVGRMNNTIVYFNNAGNTYSNHYISAPATMSSVSNSCMAPAPPENYGLNNINYA